MTQYPSPAHAIAAAWGQDLVKQADEAETVYALSGRLYLSATGWLLLSVPNALALGAFRALDVPGLELPPAGPDGNFNAHISVMRKEEVDRIGAEAITERGKTFHYGLGPVQSVVPEGWPGMSKVYFLKVISPELQELRRSYGLSGIPGDGAKPFHVSVGVVRRGVLGRGATAKAS